MPCHRAYAFQLGGVGPGGYNGLSF